MPSLARSIVSAPSSATLRACSAARAVSSALSLEAVVVATTSSAS